jgi:hypothetical protein
MMPLIARFASDSAAPVIRFCSSAASIDVGPIQTVPASLLPLKTDIKRLRVDVLLSARADITLDASRPVWRAPS